MTIASTGYVGIGTTAPINTLNVQSGTQFAGIVVTNGAATPVARLIGNTGINDGGTLQLLNGGAIQVQILGNGASYFNAGNIGIGTASPTSLLTSYEAAAKTATYTGVLHGVYDTSSTASINKVGMDIESTGTWNGTLATNTGLVVNATGGTTNYAAIFSGGSVGIGGAPVALLSLYQSSSDPSMSLQNGGNSRFWINTLSGTLLLGGVGNGQPSTAPLAISNTGNVGILPAKFFKSQTGNEPVKTWLKDLSKEDRKLVGADIRTVEFGWPIGMPVCRKIVSHKGLWEVRSSLTGGRIARILFYVKSSEMILLSGFEKTSQKTPKNELDLAIKRKKEHERHV
jgi:phage-related protein